MILPEITFSDALVDAAEIAPDKWEEHFSNYLLRRRDFFPDIDRQQTLLDHFVSDIGMGSNGLTMLEGLDGEDRYKAKCSTLRQWIALQKVPGVVEMAKAELAAGTPKLVIYGVHRCFVAEVRDMLRSFGALLIYDGTPDTKRRQMVGRFQTDPKMRVFVSAMAAVRPDVMLAVSNTIIVGEASWKRPENAAAVLRLHNRYQTRPVAARFVGLRGSADAKITQVLKSHCRNDVVAALVPSTLF